MKLSALPDKALKPLFKKYFKIISGGQKPPPIKVALYSDIIKNPKRALNSDRIVIYYPSIRTARGLYGHYVAMVRNPSTKSYYFFDPIGQKPEAVKRSADSTLYPEKMDTLLSYLIDKARDDGWSVDYSDHKLQPKGTSESCGYWSILRLIFAGQTNDQFASMVKRWADKYKASSPERFIHQFFKDEL